MRAGAKIKHSQQRVAEESPRRRGASAGLLRQKTGFNGMQRVATGFRVFGWTNNKESSMPPTFISTRMTQRIPAQYDKARYAQFARPAPSTT